MPASLLAMFRFDSFPPFSRLPRFLTVLLLAGGIPAPSAHAAFDFTFKGWVGPNGYREASAFATGDINGDGILDLVFTEWSGVSTNTIGVRLGDGRGNFNGLPDLASDGAKGGVALGDINQDGKLDLVYTGLNDGTFRTRFGIGNGEFRSEVIRGQLANTNYPDLNGITLADLDGDGHLDAVGSAQSGGVRIAFGDATGAFNNGMIAYDGAGGINNLVVVDVSGDGLPDLVYSTRIGYDLNVLSNINPTTAQGQRVNIDGGLREYTRVACARIGNSVVFALAEWSSDPDGRVFIGRNPGNSPTDVSQLPGGERLSRPAIADFDGDGIPDLAFTKDLIPGDPSGTVHLHRGFTSGAPFGGPATTVQSGWGSMGVDAVDVNHDGNPDMIVSQTGSNGPYRAFNIFLSNQESLVVTTTADENDGNARANSGTGTSLREALARASNSLSLPVITFAPYVANSNPVLQLDSPLSISTQAVFYPYTIRNTRGSITLSGRGQNRIMNVDWLLNMENLNFTNGNSNNGTGGALDLTYFANLTLNNCSFYGNTSGSGEGAAIHAPEVNTVTIRNSTFTQNSGASTIRSIGNNFTMTSTTVAGNTGKGVVTGANTAFFRNNLLSGNSGGDYQVTANSPTGSHNLIRNGTPGALTDTRTGDPLLGSFGQNGGLTRTMGFAAGSAALDSGFADSGITADQRGVARPQNGAHDIGAWEARIGTPVLSQYSLTVSSLNPVILESVVNPVPGGGTFSGEGVFADVFFPNGLTPGVRTITYTQPSGSYDLGGTVTFSITIPEVLIESLVVTTTIDEDNGTSDASKGAGTSLREAVIHANSLAGPRTITFAPALAGQTLVLDKGFNGPGDVSALVVSRNLTIRGPATAPGVTIAMATGVQKRHIYLESAAALLLDNVTFANGRATDFGGSILSRGYLTVRGCTFTGNHSDGEGGAIQSWGDSPRLNIENSTFSGNSAGTGGAFDGGALEMNFRHLTIVNNTTPSGQAVVLWKNPGTFINCLVAGNTGEGIGLSNGASLSAQSTNNLLGVGSTGGLVDGVNGNIVGVATGDLKLGGFAANGGPTKTHSLLQDSPAIDAGAIISAGSTFGDITVDQRGIGRTQLLKPDIGAYEYLAGGLRAEYYNNRTLSGFPILVRRDATVDFSANGTASPAPGVNPIGFSTRWTGFIIIPTTGNYTFYAAADDGVRLWIGDMSGAPVVNEWREQGEAEFATDSYSFTAGQRVPVKFEFDQAEGGAAARLRWQGPSIAKAIIPANYLIPSSESPGLKADFFANTSLAGTAVATRLDTSIDFTWTTSPAAGVGATNFSTRWTGFIDIPTTGSYSFHVSSDDGVRLWIGDIAGSAVVNQWVGQQETEYSTGNYTFAAGQRVPVKIEYYQGTGDAAMRLRWQGPGFAKSIIPAGALYPPVVQADAPLIATPSGTFEAPFMVTLSNTIPGAMIRYTTDGTQPTPATGFIYNSAISINGSTTLRAVAFKEGYASSAIAAAQYTVSPLAVWRALHGLSSNGSQDLANPANDGIANLLKYAFNMAPTTGSLAVPNVTALAPGGTAGLPRSYRDAEGRLVIEFVRRKAATNPGINYIVETGVSPAALSTLNLGGATVVSIDLSWERVTIADPSITDQRFGRVRVVTY